MVATPEVVATFVPARTLGWIMALENKVVPQTNTRAREERTTAAVLGYGDENKDAELFVADDAFETAPMVVSVLSFRGTDLTVVVVKHSKWTIKNKNGS